MLAGWGLLYIEMRFARLTELFCTSIAPPVCCPLIRNRDRGAVCASGNLRNAVGRASLTFAAWLKRCDGRRCHGRKNGVVHEAIFEDFCRFALCGDRAIYGRRNGRAFVGAVGRAHCYAGRHSGRDGAIAPQQRPFRCSWR